MRYCLVHSVSDKQVDFANKQALLDWISTHRFALTDKIQRMWFVHRAEKPDTLRSYIRCAPICSLRSFIVKHKL
nr:MAG TPA: hypothetical protein [Microviridae sp.]